MDELCRSIGEAQFAPVARKTPKARPQPRYCASSIGGPEQQKGPSRRRPKSDRCTSLSDAENDEYDYRQSKRNEESRPHQRHCRDRPPTDATNTQIAAFRRMS
jgi:hypothetical protein